MYRRIEKKNTGRMTKHMHEQSKTLILTQTEPESDMMYNSWIENGYCADIIFREQPKLIRALRRIWIKYGFPMCGIWYGEWKKELRKYNTIILHFSSLTHELPKWMHKKNPELRIICWYWNKVGESTLPRKNGEEKNVEWWSFDKKDCEKYQMRANIQYYCMPRISKNEKIESDIYFCGRDVGRKEQIIDVKKRAEAQGLICDFFISNKSSLMIPYFEVQKQLMKSKAILEINRKGQSGYTLRVMESLFFNKKLITDNLLIMDEPFYRKNNIFLIGYDDWEKLKEFLELPYDESVREYCKAYSLDTWFENFFV